MKNFKKIPLMILSLGLLVGGFASLTSCGEETEKKDDNGGGDEGGGTTTKKTLQSIAVTKMPDKLDYVEGDYFDRKGMVVTATYSDASTIAVSAYTIDKTAALKKTDTTITVTFQQKTTSFNITVADKPPHVYETLLEIPNADTKTYVVEAEDCDTEECKLQEGCSGFYEATPLASGGKCLACISTAGNIIKLPFETKADSTVIQINSLMAKYESGWDLLTNVKFFMDDVEFIPVLSEPLGRKEDGTNDYYNWKDVDFGKFTLAKGVHNLELRVQMGAPNIDNFTFLVNPVAKAVESIEITTNPSKTVYTEGELFDKTGMVVTAKYNDDTSKVVTDYTYTPDGILSTSDTSITVSYEGKTANVTIEVKAASVTLSSIAVTTNPTKMVYNANDQFDPAGMVVTATYSDASTATIDAYTIDSNLVNPIHDKIKISYDGKEVLLPLTVNYTEDVTISATTESTRAEAENLDKNGWIQRADMAAAGRPIVADTGVTDPLTSGGKCVEGLSNGFDMNIYIKADKPCKINASAIISNYDAVKLDSLVSFKFNGETIPTPDVTFGHRSGADYYNWKECSFGELTLNEGINMLTMSITNQAPNIDCFVFDVTEFDGVAKKKLTSISVDTQPTKLIYEVGETFDKSGMVIKANYSDSTNEVITDYTIDKDGKLGLTDTTITLSYKGQTTTVAITVNKHMEFTASEAGLYKIEAENFDLSTLSAGHSEACEGFGSNGYSIGGLGTGTTSVNFKVDNAYNATIKGRIARYESTYTLVGNIDFYVDDTLLTPTEPSEGYGTTAGNDWFNFKDVGLGTVSLAAGEHTFKMVVKKDGANIDVFEFTLA